MLETGSNHVLQVTIFLDPEREARWGAPATSSYFDKHSPNPHRRYQEKKREEQENQKGLATSDIRLHGRDSDRPTWPGTYRVPWSSANPNTDDALPFLIVRSLHRAAAEVPPPPRIGGGGVEGEARGRGHDPPARRRARARGPARRTQETGRGSVVRPGRPPRGTASRGGRHLAEHRGRRDPRGSRDRPEWPRGGPRPYGSSGSGQQAGDARRAVRGDRDRPARGEPGSRDDGRLLDAPRGVAGDPGQDARPHDPRRTVRAFVHVRRVADLGVHVPSARGTARVRRPQRLRRGFAGGRGLCRIRSRKSGSSRAATRSSLVAFAGIRAAGLGSRDSIGCVRLPNRAASTAFRRATAETISFRDGFGVSSIRRWASRPAALGSSSHCPHSGQRTTSSCSRGGRNSNATITRRRNR